MAATTVTAPIAAVSARARPADHPLRDLLAECVEAIGESFAAPLGHALARSARYAEVARLDRSTLVDIGLADALGERLHTGA